MIDHSVLIGDECMHGASPDESLAMIDHSVLIGDECMHGASPDESLITIERRASAGRRRPLRLEHQP